MIWLNQHRQNPLTCKLFHDRADKIDPVQSQQHKIWNKSNNNEYAEGLLSSLFLEWKLWKKMNKQTSWTPKIEAWDYLEEWKSKRICRTAMT